MRITAKIADEKIAEINNLLKKLQVRQFFKRTPRNGYHGLDLYNNAGCIRTLKTGTAAECAQAAYDYLCEIAVEKCLELLKEKE